MNARKIIMALLSGVLCLCIAVLGLMGALELTLFKEGYLFDQMAETGYFSTITDTARAACQGYAADAGFNAQAVDSFLTDSIVQTAIIQNVDAKFRNTVSNAKAAFSNILTYLEDAIYDETGELLTDAQKDQIAVLQISCEGAYQEATRPPFDTGLNVVLQYRSVRQWVWLTFLLVGAAALFLLQKAKETKQELGLCVQQAVLGAGASLLVVAAILEWALPYRTWMPQENISYSLFCAWWGGLPCMLAVLGAVLLAAVVLLYVRRFWLARAKQTSPAPQEEPMQAQAEQPERELDLSHAKGHVPGAKS